MLCPEGYELWQETRIRKNNFCLVILPTKLDTWGLCRTYLSQEQSWADACELLPVPNLASIRRSADKTLGDDASKMFEFHTKEESNVLTLLRENVELTVVPALTRGNLIGHQYDPLWKSLVIDERRDQTSDRMSPRHWTIWIALIKAEQSCNPSCREWLVVAWPVLLKHQNFRGHMFAICTSPNTLKFVPNSADTTE